MIDFKLEMQIKRRSKEYANSEYPDEVGDYESRREECIKHFREGVRFMKKYIHDEIAESRKSEMQRCVDYLSELQNSGISDSECMELMKKNFPNVTIRPINNNDGKG